MEHPPSQRPAGTGVARALLASSLLVAVTLLLSGAGMALALLSAVSASVATMAIVLGPTAAVAILIAVLFVRIDRLISGMATGPGEGLPGLRGTLADWLARERDVLGDADPLRASDADLRDREARALWAVRAAELVSELDADVVRLAAPEPAAVEGTREALDDLRRQVVARREVEHALRRG